MEVMLAGTGTPIPLTERKGMSIHISNDKYQLLIDCGPGSVHSLLENGINLANIEKLFFTHHHMDHNVDFFHFVIGTWVVGRSKLSIWGPKGTQDLCEGLYSAFREDLKARKTVGDRSQSGLANIDAQTISGNESINLEHWEVDTLSANHVEGLKTLAYRVREKATGNIFVYSSDTKEVSEMDDFARGADILLHDSTLSPYSGETSNDQIVWNQFTEISDDFCKHLSKIHSTPEQAAAVASAAGVGTLVLTHILPYRDEKAMSELASNKFDGRIHIGMDGLRISTE